LIADALVTGHPIQQRPKMKECGAPIRESEGVAPQISRVWSCNEQDPLEEAIVGNSPRARFPTPDRNTQVSEFPNHGTPAFAICDAGV
jgi:hypothetical protein